MLIGMFTEKVPETAHFIASYLRELALCILNTQHDRTFVPPDEINNVISKHTFLTHFASNSVLQASNVHPTMHLYFCIELVNMIFPTLQSDPGQYSAQISIMHETLFVLTDYSGGSQVNPLIDMLLL